MTSPPIRRRHALKTLCACSALGLGGMLGGTNAHAIQAGDVVNWPTVTLLSGQRLSAADVQGQSVLVVFWSTTCPFCLRHNAHIEKLRRAASGGKLRIVTVAREKDAEPVHQYLRKHGYGFDVTLDHAAMSAALSARKIIPLTVLITPDGRLKMAIPGEMFEEDVMTWAALA